MAELTPMSDDDPEDHSESAVALRAKAAHCLAVAKVVDTEATRARLIQIASDYLVRAAQLDHDQKK